MSLRCQVMWMFRQKAKLRGVGFKHSMDIEKQVLGEMAKIGYRVNRIFRGNQYEPHALFGGKIYIGGKDLHRKEKVITVGRLLNEGFSNRAIMRMTGVDNGTVARIKGAINSYLTKKLEAVN